MYLNTKSKPISSEENNDDAIEAILTVVKIVATAVIIISGFLMLSM